MEKALEKKEYMAAAIISNCPVPSRRDEYIQELQEAGIDVHVYGLCGRYRCSDLGWQQKRPRICYEELSPKYMFYLAFENAFCKDYVSEKLYQSLLYPWVPVVRGGINYDEYLPTKNMVVDASKINAYQLAEELKRIASNTTLYTEYFKWRRRYEQTIPEYREVDTCKICNKLKRTKWARTTFGAGHKWYKSLYDWWWMDSHCVFYSPATILGPADKST
jgi:hypothetical protein